MAMMELSHSQTHIMDNQIDDVFGNRYNWNRIKRTLSDYQNNYIGQSLDDYLQKQLVIF